MQLTTKPHLLEEIHRERAELEAALARISPDRRSHPLQADGWSIKDILAHIVAWEQVMLRWLQASLAGETPADPAPGLTDDDVERLNSAFFRANRDRALVEVEDEFQRSYAEVIEALEAAPEPVLMQPGYFTWTEEWPLATVVATNTSDHYREHREQIAAWAEAAA